MNWAAAGPSFTNLGNPFTVNSSGGVAVTASKAGGSFRRMTQDGSFSTPGSWNGNFAAGDALLWTDTPITGGPGPIDLTFGVAVNGAGAQVQANLFGPFTGTIDAFDASNNLLFSGAFSGVSSSAQDNSAVFVGVKSPLANIKRLRINAGNGDFAINRLDLVQGTSVVPEPASLALALPGVFPIGLMALRRRKRAA